MGSPFDFVKAVMEERVDLGNELDFKDYIPFVINRACSFRVDAVAAVQLVNERSDMPTKGQYRILRSLIKKRPTARDEFWIKDAKASEAVQLIMNAWGIGRNKAEEIVRTLGTDKIMNDRRT